MGPGAGGGPGVGGGVGGGGRRPPSRDLAGGFSPGATSFLEWPGRAVFVKAVGRELNPESPVLHRREAMISAALPRSPRSPPARHLRRRRLGGAGLRGGAGRPPRHPWDRPTSWAGSRALGAARRAHARPVPALEALADYRRPLFGGWSELAARAEPPAGPRPLGAAPPRPSGRARVPLARRLRRLDPGPRRRPLRQRVGHRRRRRLRRLAPRRGGQPGLRPRRLGALGRARGRAAPEDLLALSTVRVAVDPDALTVLLAAVAGFFVSHSLRPPPPGLPTLRPFQAAQGAVALAWLRRRTGW